jgi:hypothetical protein
MLTLPKHIKRKILTSSPHHYWSAAGDSHNLMNVTLSKHFQPVIGNLFAARGKRFWMLLIDSTAHKAWVIRRTLNSAVLLHEFGLDPTLSSSQHTQCEYMGMSTVSYDIWFYIWWQKYPRKLTLRTQTRSQGLHLEETWIVFCTMHTTDDLIALH